MSDLYFEGNVTTAFEAARKAGEYAVKGDFTDIHLVDAALEAAGQIHALTREHVHPVGDAPPSDPALVGERILELCEAHETAPVSHSTEAGLDPATIALLFQLATLLKELYFRWKS
jgi:hypothetical protein